MDAKLLIEHISNQKSDIENFEDYLNSLDPNSQFVFALMLRIVQIFSEEDLEVLEKNLELNTAIQTFYLGIPDLTSEYIISIIREDALCLTFDEKIIRRALYKGFYPMSIYFDGLNFLTIRSHFFKCIVKMEDLQIPHNAHKFMENEFSDCTLTFNRDFKKCISILCESYKGNTWLSEPLVNCLISIHENPDEFVSVDSVELWRGDKLIAGEIGFITRGAYASLSGFHTEKNSGTVQLAALALYLKENRFKYWDLGMSVPYKYKYGAEDFSRDEQNELWENLSGTRLKFMSEDIPIKKFLSNGTLKNKPQKIDENKIVRFPTPGILNVELPRSVCLVTEDINLQRLYSAYMQGIFPWFCEDAHEKVMWHSPAIRFCIEKKDLHIPKSLHKFMKKTPYTYTIDKCFKRVMEECAKAKRKGQRSTWIGKKMISAYTKFHNEGFAHSFEVWYEGNLVGGFYGVLIGSVFFGESMFTKMPNSSKSAFAFFAKTFFDCGGVLIDSQCYTENIARYGGKNISRDAFLYLESISLNRPLEKDIKTEFFRSMKYEV